MVHRATSKSTLFALIRQLPACIAGNEWSPSTPRIAGIKPSRSEALRRLVEMAVKIKDKR